ncbi:MAG: hypothetical protein AAGC84_11510 [Pseudomonas sp.]
MSVEEKGTPGQLKKIGYRFTSGALRSAQMAYVMCIDPGLDEEKLPHTVLDVWDTDEAEDWATAKILRWNACSTCVAQTPKRQSVTIGEHGHVFVFGSGDNHEESITLPGGTLNLLREVRCIDGEAYACAMDRQVFRRLGQDHWQAIHGTMPEQPADDPVFGFESIHGFASDDIYAVGWHGEIWQFNGKQWRRCTSPTNVILTRVFCADDGLVYIAGQQGVLLRGRDDSWEVIDHEDTEADLWDLQWFDGALYISTMYSIFRLHGEHLELVDCGDATPGSCYHLDSADGILWSIGADDIVQFDGHTWTRIE